MKVHSYEKAVLGVGIAILIGCAVALAYATLGMGIHLPGAEGRIDPARVYQTPPFNQPGVRQIGPGRYEAVVVAQAWAFNPAEIRVPAGAEVLFTVTSTDVLHGFNVEGTRLNLMLIPGQISRNRYRFAEPGEYLLICHEYCGIAHHTMAGRVIVEPSSEVVARTTAAAHPGNHP